MVRIVNVPSSVRESFINGKKNFDLGILFCGYGPVAQSGRASAF